MNTNPGSSEDHFDSVGNGCRLSHLPDVIAEGLPAYTPWVRTQESKEFVARHRMLVTTPRLTVPNSIILNNALHSYITQNHRHTSSEWQAAFSWRLPGVVNPKPNQHKAHLKSAIFSSLCSLFFLSATFTKLSHAAPFCDSIHKNHHSSSSTVPSTSDV